MNNDSITPSPAPAPAPSEESQPPTTTQVRSDAPANGAAGAPAREQPPVLLTPAQKRAQVQTKKKHEFINYLMNNLDLVIYSELCILYYME